MKSNNHTDTNISMNTKRIETLVDGIFALAKTYSLGWSPHQSQTNQLKVG